MLREDAQPVAVVEIQPPKVGLLLFWQGSTEAVMLPWNSSDCLLLCREGSSQSLANFHHGILFAQIPFQPEEALFPVGRTDKS